MFDELANAARVVQDTLEAKGTRVGNWRALYKLYLAVEDVIASAEWALDELAPRTQR
jgi:hypothetical protein